MENIEYANAYSEVVEILKFLSDEDYEKIPSNVREVIRFNANKEYKFFYNPNKTLDEQNVSKIAKSIIAVLYRDYWATPEQKEKILSAQKQIFNKLEENKNEKYEVDALKNRRNLQKEKLEKNINIPIEAEKENFFKRIIKRIKTIFKY